MRRGLTADERGHVLTALVFLHTRVGTWKVLAKAPGFEAETLKNVRKGVNRPSVNLAFQISRMGGVPFDDVTSGRFPAPGTCPHCGRGP